MVVHLQPRTSPYYALVVCSSEQAASEGFDLRSEPDLSCPGAARLAQDIEIGLRDRIGVELAVRLVGRVGPRVAASSAVDYEWAT